MHDSPDLKDAPDIRHRVVRLVGYVTQMLPRNIRTYSKLGNRRVAQHTNPQIIRSASPRVHDGELFCFCFFV